MKDTRPRRPTVSLTAPGQFAIGCNYWASHAGTAMWSNWQPQIVAADLKKLAHGGLQILRVFPLWPDFQPVSALRGFHGRQIDYRHGEEVLPATPAGQAGLSAVALQRFRFLADQAAAQGLRLIVGLVTGWMSGRLFVPPALEGRSLLTDPLAIQWTLRFVTAFVSEFRDHPAILAWDLGNECNCLGPAASRESAWVWTAAVSQAIRAADPSRPVVSGMHGMSPANDAVWTIQDQAELNDLLTVHPYPIFTPHCDRDPITTFRAAAHAAAETRYYADIGGKPCFTEEIGSLGPMCADDETAAAYLRLVLFSTWAQDGRGLLWWCAFDQAHLSHPPYDWFTVERELGLLRADGSPKPIMEELGRFRRFLDRLPVSALPPRQTHAVCVLTPGQDSWAAAYSAFLLGQQAGLELEFQYSDQPLKPAPLYLLPSLSGSQVFPRRLGLALEEKVRKGAHLYASLDNAFLAPFTEWFGLRVQTREQRSEPAALDLSAIDPTLRVSFPSSYRWNFQPAGARVLGRERDGNPAFARHRVGRGSVTLLTVPLETELAKRPGAFHEAHQPPFWKLYRSFAMPVLAGRAWTQPHPQVGITEHALSAQERVIVAINYSNAPVQLAPAWAAGWQPKQRWYGPPATDGGLQIGAHDAAVWLTARSPKGSATKKAKRPTA